MDLNYRRFILHTVFFLIKDTSYSFENIKGHWFHKLVVYLGLRNMFLSNKNKENTFATLL